MKWKTQNRESLREREIRNPGELCRVPEDNFEGQHYLLGTTRITRSMVGFRCSIFRECLDFSFVQFGCSGFVRTGLLVGRLDQSFLLLVTVATVREPVLLSL